MNRSVTFTAMALLIAAFAAARRRFLLVTVRGNSMAPALVDQQRILVHRRAGDACRRGEVVVFRHPGVDFHGLDGLPYLVKRVAAASGDIIPAELQHAASAPDGRVPTGQLLVLGDHTRSLDSRQFGYVPTGDVIGTAL